jgi:hypothetical protein
LPSLRDAGERLTNGGTDAAPETVRCRADRFALAFTANIPALAASLAAHSFRIHPPCQSGAFGISLTAPPCTEQAPGANHIEELVQSRVISR